MTDSMVDRPPQAGHEPAPHPKIEERVARGKAARSQVPLEKHAEAGGEPVDVLTLLREQERGRVEDLLPIRHGRMLASPFAFFRGSAGVMAADLAALPNTGLGAQLCGDAHLSNFGVYATPERRLVLDVNDFDETLPGPFEWDVKRLAASLAVAGRGNGHGGPERNKTVVAVVNTYRTAMRTFAKMGNLAVWYASLDAEQAVADLAPRFKSSERRRTQAALERARTKDNADALRKLTRSDSSGRPRFVNDPPLIVPADQLLPDVGAAALRQTLLDVIRSYRGTLVEDRRYLLDQFDLVDIARKVVGVGSVGTRAYVLLFMGRDDTDPLVLQGKEAGPSVLEPYCGRSEYSTAGQRVVVGQRLVQAASDIFLGWDRLVGADGVERDFYVRQLRDGKASADVEDLSPRRLTIYGQLCAWTLARAHARSGDRVAIAAYLGKHDTFEHALAEYAESYADRTEAQYAQLREAADRGEIEATTGI